MINRNPSINNRRSGRNNIVGKTILTTTLNSIEEALNEYDIRYIEIVSAMKEIGKEDNRVLIWYGVEVYLFGIEKNIFKCISFLIEVTKDKEIVNRKTIAVRQRLWKLTRQFNKYIERRLNTILFKNKIELTVEKHECYIKKLLYMKKFTG